MTHYSENPGTVRVDYFNRSGKWYMTEAIDMSDYWHEDYVHTAIEKSLDASRPDREPGWWRHFTVVILEPYHENAYPIMIVAKDVE